jgi:hypothetical protein
MNERAKGFYRAVDLLVDAVRQNPDNFPAQARFLRGKLQEACDFDLMEDLFYLLLPPSAHADAPPDRDGN